MLTVPFENLSIHYNQPISLDEASLFKKLVTNNRGGFCYELNCLFAGLLQQIGFKVSMVAASVATKDAGFGPPFDHMALLVGLDEDFLVDVGFGDSFQFPLRVAERNGQPQGTMSYQINLEGDAYILGKQNSGTLDAGTAPQYRFTIQPRTVAEFKDMCDYHQTSPLSHFTQKRICSLATREGRISLSDVRLIVTSKGLRTESTLASEAEFKRVLRDNFGIVI